MQMKTFSELINLEWLIYTFIVHILLKYYTLLESGILNSQRTISKKIDSVQTGTVKFVSLTAFVWIQVTDGYVIWIHF